MKRGPEPAAVHSSICWSPSELPKAAMGRRPMKVSMPTGLPGLSSMKLICGRRMMTGPPFCVSNCVFMVLPTTCSGGMP